MHFTSFESMMMDQIQLFSFGCMILGSLLSTLSGLKLRAKFCSKHVWSQWLKYHSITFFLDVNFDKFIIRLHFILISFILAKYLENQRSIIMLLTNFYISSFCNIRLCIKNKFMNRIVNNIRLE